MPALPETVGPYRIRQILGRGGMGVVYRGEHRDTGAPAAVKVVSRTSGAGIEGIRREIHALGRVEHPGVVRVVDQGTNGGLPWYAMELLEGRTLRSLLDERRDAGGAPCADAIGIVATLCEPLAVVHAAGLVHRDIKPENVLVGPDGRPVLIDFGVAAGFGGAAGREALAAAGDVAGTVEYMAPELILGELCDARADLYALGCVLYECLASRTPFAGGTRDEILRAHLGEPPPAPSRLGAASPPELDALVLRLLAKRPADRLGYAADLATALHAMGHGAARGRPDPAGAQTLPYLYRAELSGRGEIMARARRAIDALARERRGGAIYAGGESGAGKTRLGVEITREAAEAGATVVTGQCLPLGRSGATPLHPLLPLVRAAAALAHEGDEAATVLAGPRARVLAPYFPELASLPGYGGAPAPAPLPPDAARARVLDALAAVALGLAERSPLLLVLDDVQWADELSLALLARLDPPTLASRGLLVVCLYRDEEANEALLSRAHTNGVERWTVGRLDEDGIRAMAAGMLAARSVPRAWGAFLAHVSGGNPFFAGEYLRASVEAGLLTRDAAGRWSLRAVDAARGEALPVPATVEAILDGRLAQLGPEERRLAEAAAVLGRTLDGDIAAATAGMGAGAALDAVSALARRQILEEDGEGRLRFVHDRLRDAAYTRLDPEARRAFHARAAAAIEARREGDPEALAILSHHHAAAGRHDAAYWYATGAARQAEAAYANEQAIALYRAALGAAEAGGAADARFADAWTRLGDLQARGGRPAEAHEAFAEALARVPPEHGPLRAELCIKQGKTWEVRSCHVEALGAYDQAEHALGDAPPAGDGARTWGHTWVQIQIERITIHYWAANVEALARVVARLHPVVEERGTDAQRALFFQSLVQADLRGARYRTSAETVDRARRCLAGFLRGGDLPEIARARFTLAAVLLWNDALDEAADQMLTTLEESEAVGLVPVQVSCLAYLAVIGRRQRDADAARVMSFRCTAAAGEAAGLRQYVGVAEANLGWVHLQDESPEEAGRLCQAALDRWQGLPLAYPFHWLARLPLMRLAAGAGQDDEARDHARAMLDMAQQRLPDALATALGRAASPGGDAVATAEALRVAEEAGFL